MYTIGFEDLDNLNFALARRVYSGGVYLVNSGVKLTLGQMFTLTLYTYPNAPKLNRIGFNISKEQPQIMKAENECFCESPQLRLLATDFKEKDSIQSKFRIFLVYK